ncbi:hypothetical protein, partial [Mycoplasma todarodis]
AIKAATGVDIPKSVGKTTVTGVVLTPNPDGTIDVKVSTSTKGAYPEAKDTKGTVKGNTDATVKKSIDRDKNLDTIKKAIDGKDITQKQGGKKASEIAKKIADMKKAGKSIDEILKAIKAATGIDIPKSVGKTTVTGVVLTPNKDGTVDVKVSTSTKGAYPEAKDTTGKAKGNTDATADATATKNKNEADIKKKID